MSRDTAALIAFIDSRQNTPHEWGSDKNDCISFALGAIEAQTGKRLTKRKWTSKVSGLRMLQRLGGMEAVIDRHLKRIPPSLAKRGDIAGVPDAELGIHPMVVEGETLVCPGDKGSRRAKRRVMITAWSADV